MKTYQRMKRKDNQIDHILTNSLPQQRRSPAGSKPRTDFSLFYSSSNSQDLLPESPSSKEELSTVTVVSPYETNVMKANILDLPLAQWSESQNKRKGMSLDSLKIPALEVISVAQIEPFQQQSSSDVCLTPGSVVWAKKAHQLWWSAEMSSIHINQYTTQILGVILALLDDSDESVQLTAVSCLLMVLKSSPNDAVEPILLSLSVRLRNLQVCMNMKIRANAFAAFGALVNYGIGALHEPFVEQVHAAFPRLVLHLHDEDRGVRQACGNTLKRVADLVGMDGMSALFNTHRISSDHRSDYEDFLRDLASQITQNLASRIDTYMASTVQAFDAPWPVIQANAIYLSSSMLAISDDQHFSALYYSQVFGILVGQTRQSADPIVRSTCSSAIGLLLKATDSFSWRDARLDRLDSARSSQESESTKK